MFPPTNTFTFSTGSVIVEMDKVRERELTDTVDIDLLWIGSSNGLLSTSQNNNIQLISSGVRQMFTQSPYLYRSEQP